MKKLFKETVIGHRGAPAYVTENTIASFVHAVRMGVKWLEFDVQLAKCGTPIVFHDSRLNRLLGIDAKVAALTADQLAVLPFAAKHADGDPGIYIPTLEALLEVLAQFDVKINIELKSTERQPTLFVQNVLSVIANSSFKNTILISSFQLLLLEKVRFYAPDMPISYLNAKPQPSIIPHLTELSFTAVGINLKYVSKQAIANFHKSNLQVMVYTVNCPQEAMLLFNWGVDAIFTDLPYLLSDAREAKNEKDDLSR